MDSTLDLLNYSPRIPMAGEGADQAVKDVHEDTTKYILNSKEETNLCSMAGTEESGFQEESGHWMPHSNSSKSYPDPEDPFESWFTSESDMLILYEIFGEFYDEEFEKLSYVEKKALKDKVAVSIPKSPEELMRMYPEENASLLSNNSFFRHSQFNDTSQGEDSMIISQVTEEDVDKDFAEWFEPIEELILFDILGIDYREHFEAMTLKEKKELRLRVDNTEPKSKEEILAMLDEGESEQDQEETLHHPNDEKEIETPKTSPIKVQDKKEKSRRLTLIVQNPEPQMKKASKKKTSNAHSSCRTPLRSNEALNMPSYLRPTSASAHRERTPQSIDKLRCPRLHDGHYLGYSPKQTHTRRLATGIDLSKVVSPVAQYIHSSPAPPLIRHVKSSRSKRLLSECTKENNPPSSPAKEDYAPLPEANYKSSPLVTEQEMESDTKSSHYKNCFSPSESVEPKIFRHLGRVKVPKSIQLNDCGSENLDNLLPSPSFSGSPCKMTLRKNAARESLGPVSNESMIDMSVHEVKAVRKLYDFEN